MSNRTDTAEHTKAFIYPVMDARGGGQRAPAQGRFERSTVEHANHQTRWLPQVRGSIYSGPQQGGLLPIGGYALSVSKAIFRART